LDLQRPAFAVLGEIGLPPGDLRSAFNEPATNSDKKQIPLNYAQPFNGLGIRLVGKTDRPTSKLLTSN
jgi:hypothetical protein